jgi:hypothetical protein
MGPRRRLPNDPVVLPSLDGLFDALREEGRASTWTSATRTAARSGRREPAGTGQRLSHKFNTWHDQFGESGRVGCGRCIVWCPVGIDVTGLAALNAHPPTTPEDPP